MGGHRRWGGQVVTGGLETVLIGDPVDGDELTFWGSVRVGSLLDATDIFGFGSDLFLITTGLCFNAILSLVTELKLIKYDLIVFF